MYLLVSAKLNDQYIHVCALYTPSITGKPLEIALFFGTGWS